MSLLHWRQKLTPQLLKQIGGSPDQIAVLIKVIPQVMVSLEDVLVKKYNIKVVRRIASAGYISAIVDREKIAEIAKMPQVISITHIPQVGLLQKANVKVIPALPYMKAKTTAEPTMLGEISDFLKLTPLKTGGITGKNVIIGIVDSGIALHPMLDGKIFKEKNFIGASPRDLIGHGSHTAGIVAGNRVTSPKGPTEGMAPDAKIINAKIFDQNTTSADICMQGLEYAAMNGSHIISCSWGSSEHFEPFHDVIRTLKARYGCIFVCAAGNSGPDNASIVCPADSEDVVAVGSVSKIGIISQWSSKGPTYDGRIKPDLMGVGQDVYSSYLNGGYETLSGTSMATPTISGGLACLLQLGKINVNSVYGHASKGGVKDNSYGYGFPDFSKSRVEAIKAGLPTNLIMNLGILPFGVIITKWAK